MKFFDGLWHYRGDLRHTAGRSAGSGTAAPVSGGEPMKRRLIDLLLFLALLDARPAEHELCLRDANGSGPHF